MTLLDPSWQGHFLLEGSARLSLASPCLDRLLQARSRRPSSSTPSRFPSLLADHLQEEAGLLQTLPLPDLHGHGTSNQEQQLKSDLVCSQTIKTETMTWVRTLSRCCPTSQLDLTALVRHSVGERGGYELQEEEQADGAIG